MSYPDILERFISYVTLDTQSSEDSQTYPSTAKQLDLAKKLKEELSELGLDDVQVNEWGYVLATLPANRPQSLPTVALIGHLDTSPDVSGARVQPQIHRHYDGRDICLSAKDKLVLRVEENSYLKEQIGKTIVTSDGSTLLGADDKAGIAEIMDALTQLVKNPSWPRPRVRVMFTPDEEVGRGVEHISVAEIAADVGYTVDGEKLGEIEDETFCADSLEIKITGINVHPGMAKNKLVNALKIAARIIEKLPRRSLSPETTARRQGYVHPHHLAGNVESATLKLLIRDFMEEGLKKKEALIKEIVERVVGQFPGAAFEWKVIESYRNMKQVLSRYPQVLKKAERAVALAGLKPKRARIRGGTDGARLCFMGLPTPNLFTGGNNFHSRTEWIALEDMQKASEVLVHLLKLWTES